MSFLSPFKSLGFFFLLLCCVASDARRPLICGFQKNNPPDRTEVQYALFDLCTNAMPAVSSGDSNGTWLFIDRFPSKYIGPRPVEIWLPPQYDSTSGKRYRLIIAHDGQNLFCDSAAFKGVSWRLGRVLDSLSRAGTIEPAIVVAPWNGGRMRFSEYVPNHPPYLEQDQALEYLRYRTKQDTVFSDNYMAFLANELLPWARSKFRIAENKEAITLMGSSMGALSSLYACVLYPDLFGNAICMSTAWATKPPGAGERMIHWLSHNLPDPADHCLYFDYGTRGLDSLYESFQLEMDKHLKARGYQSESNWISKCYPGASHDEIAWGHRVAAPLLFVLRKR